MVHFVFIKIVFILKGKQEKEDFEHMIKCLMQKKYIHVKEILKTFNKLHHGSLLHSWRFPIDDRASDETLLHIAANQRDKGEFVTRVLQVCPDLVLDVRSDPRLKGQTALHIAIASGNRSAFRTIMRVAGLLSPTSLRKLLNTRATGSAFGKTVMMGELPLFAAALSFDHDMVAEMLQQGAKPYMTNSKGDTVFHSIIKYVSFNKDKIGDARRMIYSIHQALNKNISMQKSRLKINGTQSKCKDYRHVWFIKNKKGNTALKLAAKYHLAEICNDILNLEDIYCIHNIESGLFDEKRHDITELDSITQYKAQMEDTNQDGVLSRIRYRKRESVLETMFNREQKTNRITMIELPPVKALIKIKWKMYRPFYIGWMLFHHIFIVLLSMYAVYRAELVFHPKGNTTKEVMYKTTENFVAVFRWIGFAVAIVYFFVTLIVIAAEVRKPALCRHWTSNNVYITFLLVFSVGIILDTLYYIAIPDHDGIPLCIAIIAGWGFNLFFLRGWRLFGFFTVMLRRVITGDWLRFFVLIALQLTCFTVAMMMVYQGTDTPAFDGTEKNPGNETLFGRSLLKMFNVMFGLSSIELLMDARVRYIANSLYVVFIFTTYILLVNSLIAMMSRTCANLLMNKYDHWRLSQLSVIFFLEDILFPFCTRFIVKCPGVETVLSIYDPTTSTFKDESRFFIDMKAIEETFSRDIDEELETIKKIEQLEVNSASDRKLINKIEKEGTLHAITPKKKSTIILDPTPPASESSEEEIEELSTPVIPIFHEYTQQGSDMEDTESRPDSMTEANMKRLKSGRVIMMHHSTEYKK